MMQCVRRCSFICGAVLSILLLLCSCQAGAGPLILPDNVPSKNTSQGKEKLLAALNQEYFDRFKRSNYFIQGSDSAAEAAFLYLAHNSGGDINKAVEFLAENPEDEDGRANCADDVLRIISPSPSKTYWVSYSFLSADYAYPFQSGAGYAHRAFVKPQRFGEICPYRIHVFCKLRLLRLNDSRHVNELIARLIE